MQPVHVHRKLYSGSTPQHYLYNEIAISLSFQKTGRRPIDIWELLLVARGLLRSDFFIGCGDQSMRFFMRPTLAIARLLRAFAKDNTDGGGSGAWHCWALF